MGWAVRLHVMLEGGQLVTTGETQGLKSLPQTYMCLGEDGWMSCNPGRCRKNELQQLQNKVEMGCWDAEEDSLGWGDNQAVTGS